MTNRLNLEIDEFERAFAPGSIVTGRVSWSVDRVPKKAEVRLFWFTEGKGTGDAQTADATPLDNPAANDDRTFQLQLPPGPYSCSGQLISIIWAVEAIIDPGKHTERVELVVSPTGAEIRLGESRPVAQA